MLLRLFGSLKYVAISLAMLAPAFAQDAAPPAPPAAPQSSAAGATGEATGSKANSPAMINGKPIVGVSKDVKPPSAVYSPDPSYPAAPRRAGFQATVMLWLVVDTDGSPKRIRVQQSAGMGFDEAAIDMVKTWRFQPATRNGEPVPVEVMVETNFRLDARNVDAPLHSPPEAHLKPPQFPGVDLSAYPLIVQIDGANGISDGQSYRIVAEATLKDATGERSFSMTCSGAKNHCLYLSQGKYPARWLSEDRQLEIMGKEVRSKSWRAAQYSVQAPGKASPATP